jgi:hypothetical protein
VSVLLGAAGRRRRAASQFTVARRSRYDAQAPATAEQPMGTTPQSAPGWTQSFLSTPGLHPPSVQVIQHSRPDATGDVFLAPAHGPGQYGPMILDGEGALVWFQQAPPGDVAMNFQVERYEDKPVLVWWQGTITRLGIGFGVDELYSSSYQPIAQIAAGNGYRADLHDLQITSAGSAFITADSVVRADLSPVGGSRNGTLVDSILQEIDVKTGLVMFEWHALGHVPLSASYSALGATNQPWDYFHINSISLDPWGDSNFIISARNTWAAYEISAASGSILWRLGGRRPSFHMGPGTGMAWQHDVRWQPDHTLTLFDDGATPREHAQSRAIRERIDWRRRSTTLVGRLVHSPALTAGSQGDDQVLADGGSFVGWGEAPYITQFGASGAILFDARLPPQGQSYRAYRFPWSGTPVTPPSLVVSEDGAGMVTAYASWNGATGVHAWMLLAGGSSAALHPITTVPRGGFETAIAAHTTSRWFAARALGSSGQVLASSATVSL